MLPSMYFRIPVWVHPGLEPAPLVERTMVTTIMTYSMTNRSMKEGEIFFSAGPVIYIYHLLVAKLLYDYTCFRLSVRPKLFGGHLTFSAHTKILLFIHISISCEDSSYQ